MKRIPIIALAAALLIFAGLGSGTFVTSQSNISVEIGKVGDAGNTNAMLTAFRLPGLIFGPFIFAYFVNLGNINFFLFVSSFILKMIAF